MVGAAIKTPTASTPPPAPKPRPTTPPRKGGARRGGRPATFIRIAFTVFIVWHFAGVFLAALCVPASSPLVMDIAQNWPMQWYLDAIYMNQGHSFFAPEVGPGPHDPLQLYDQTIRSSNKANFRAEKNIGPAALSPLFHAGRSVGFAMFDDKPTHDLWQRKYLEAFGRQLLREHTQAQTVVSASTIIGRSLRTTYQGGLKNIRNQIQQLNEQKRTAEATNFPATSSKKQ